jgi:non-heme chloroperoxidase
MFDSSLSSRVFMAVLAALSLSAAQAAAAPHDLFVGVSRDVQIHIRVAGPASAKHSLVLIPGWRLTASIWKEQLATFSKERRVIVIDPRSQGDSTKTAEGDTPEQRAKDLDAVLKQQKLESIVLVGWSQGVQDVASYVQQFGTRSLAGMVLVDSTVSHGAQGISDSPRLAAQQLGLFVLYSADPQSYTRGMMRAIIKRTLPQQEFETLVADALRTPTAIGEAMLIADLFGVDRSAALAKFDRPTLVIASSSSQELDAQKIMASNLPQGRIEIIDDAAHAVFVDQPERFDRLLTTFLAQIDLGEPTHMYSRRPD